MRQYPVNENLNMADKKRKKQKKKKKKKHRSGKSLEHAEGHLEHVDRMELPGKDDTDDVLERLLPEITDAVYSDETDTEHRNTSSAEGLREKRKKKKKKHHRSENPLENSIRMIRSPGKHNKDDSDIMGVSHASERDDSGYSHEEDTEYEEISPVKEPRKKHRQKREKKKHRRAKNALEQPVNVMGSPDKDNSVKALGRFVSEMVDPGYSDKRNSEPGKKLFVKQVREKHKKKKKKHHQSEISLGGTLDHVNMMVSPDKDADKHDIRLDKLNVSETGDPSFSYERTVSVEAAKERQKKIKKKKKHCQSVNSLEGTLDHVDMTVSPDKDTDTHDTSHNKCNASVDPSFSYEKTDSEEAAKERDKKRKKKKRHHQHDQSETSLEHVEQPINTIDEDCSHMPFMLARIASEVSDAVYSEGKKKHKKRKHAQSENDNHENEELRGHENTQPSTTGHNKRKRKHDRQQENEEGNSCASKAKWQKAHASASETNASASHHEYDTLCAPNCNHNGACDDEPDDDLSYVEGEENRELCELIHACSMGHQSAYLLNVLHTAGIQWKVGQWSRQEEDVLFRNWQCFQQAHPVKNTDLLFQRKFTDKNSAREVRTFIVRTNMWIKLCRGIARPVNAICKRACMLIPGLKRGVFSVEETSRLKELVEVHGRHFALIGRLMNRNVISVTEKWRSLTKCQSDYLGCWTPEEDRRLTDAVMAELGGTLIGYNRTVCEKLPWKSISDTVRSRSLFACKKRW